MQSTGLNSLFSRTWFTPDLGLGCHYFQYSTTQYDGLAHTHGEYCFLACIDGEIEVSYTHDRELIRPGEFVVVNPGQIHQCRFGVGKETASGFTVILGASLMHRIIETMCLPFLPAGRDLRFRGKHRNSDAFELIVKATAELQDHRPGRETLLELLARQILIYLARSWPAARLEINDLQLLPQLPWVQMHRATEFMNSHGKTSFRLTDLCAEVGLSASRFIPLFRNSCGISPHSYYNSLLVFKARRLLHDKHASTKEAAYALGFRNVSHFCALFHQITGTTPQTDQPPGDHICVLGR